jgi:hypothetical protein
VRNLLAFALALAAAASTATGATRPPDPATCSALFARYDTAARVYGTPSFRDDTGVTPPAPLSRWIVQLRSNGCLTTADDLVDLDALARRLAPFAMATGGPAIRATPVHLGIVTGIGDEVRVTGFFRGLGYRSRGVGAEGLGRRLYIGPFTTQAALDQALALAREAGFIAPYAATHTRF